MSANFVTADDVFDEWQNTLLTGQAPVLYRIGSGELGRIELGPGLVTLFGGAPGVGKTAFTMQAVCDALLLTTDLRALVCNVEMPPGVLLDRQLARLGGLCSKTIRARKQDASHGGRLQTGLTLVQKFADRLAFVRPPFNLENVAAAADAFGAGLMVLDYAQRISPPGRHGDQRNSVNALMQYLRQFADAGVAVLVVAAVGRTKDQKGRSSYDADGLNLASFRESSELEFGADSAWLLAPDRNDAEVVKLRCLKNRHGETDELVLHFDKTHQRFSPLGGYGAKSEPDGKLTSALQSLWDGTGSADDDLGHAEGEGLDDEA